MASIRTSGSTVAAGGRRGGHNPLFIGAVAILFLAVFVIGFLGQIQTNEAPLLGGANIDVFQPNWAVLMQIPNLFMGTLSANEATAAIVGWGIEILYLGFIVGGVELMKDAAHRSGRVIGSILITGAIGIVIYGMYNDYRYGTMPYLGHIGFAIMMSFIVGFFGTAGIYLLEKAWQRA